MYLEQQTFIHYYNSDREDLYITEFGHSLRQTPRKIGPWVRDVYLLHYVVKRKCHFCDFDVGSGGALLISKGNMHSFFVEPGYEHFWIGFDGIKIPTLAALFGWDLRRHQHLHLLPTSFDLTEQYRTVFQNGNELNSENAVIGLLLSTLSLIDNRTRANQNGSYVTQAKSFIDRNYHRKITLEEVATYIHISEKYMCRLFKQELQLTPQRYLQSVRMEQAKNLLSGTSMRIRDIATTVGYPSQLAFSSAFSAFFGISPTEYRERTTHPS